MRKFTEMEFFRTLKDFQISKQNITLLENTFKEFTEGLFLESECGCNLIQFYNQLCYARAELMYFLKGDKTNQDKKPAVTKVYSKKALLLVNAQIKLVRWQIRNSNKNQTRQENHHSIKTKIKWTGTIYELVELGYATLENKSFNNGEVDIKELMEYLCDVFDFEVKDCYRVFVDIHHRAGDRTIYLDKLKKKLIEKMERLDGKKVKSLF